MAENQQSINRRRGRQFERDVLDRISSACTFGGVIGSGKATRSTPDIVCVQNADKYSPKVRLVEAKINGYIPPDQRKELLEIAKESPDNVQIEVHYRPSPRKKKKRTIAKDGWSIDKTEEILENEFDHKKLEE